MSSTLEKLEMLYRRDLLSDIDMEFCRFLSRQEMGTDGSVLIAACLASNLQRRGNVCIDLEELAGRPVAACLESREPPLSEQWKTPDLDEWTEAIKGSAVAGEPGDYTPLILDRNGRLYLQKHWQYERELADNIRDLAGRTSLAVDRSGARSCLDRLFDSGKSPDWQKIAAATTLHSRFTVITGGPGTGKTTTILRILAMMLEQSVGDEPGMRIALAASTGKAARRLKESIQEGISGLNTPEEVKERIPERPKTVHQLLGARYDGTYRYGEGRPMPYDLVVVDEASMIDQLLMSRLVGALPESAGIILLGDKDQLASVEAGSVLGDICGGPVSKFSKERAETLGEYGIELPDNSIDPAAGSLADSIIELTKNYRFGSDSGIAEAARNINRGNADRVLEVLADNGYPDFTQTVFEGEDAYYKALEEYIVPRFREILELDDPGEVLGYINGSRILSAHRVGPLGSEHLNQMVRRILTDHGLIPPGGRWYRGRPVLVTRNDYGMQLRNGDLGVAWIDRDERFRIYFEDRETGYRSIAPSRLPKHSTAHAVTVHKSQGSEFDRVLFVLPAQPSAILTRELVYTAITRSRQACHVWGASEVLRGAIERKTRRYSGLEDLLWN